MKKILGSFIIATTGGLISVLIYSQFFNQNIQLENPDNKATVQQVGLNVSKPISEINYVSAAELTVNGVVHVKTEGTLEYRQQAFDPLRQFFYGNGNIERQYSQPIKGAGSGVLISEDGFVVTNNHVIENADQIKITLNNKKTYEAELIGRDPTTDLAVLKIEEEGLPYLGYGDSDDLKIGEWVLAVGNPFNLTSTVTAGIVSAKSRDINILENDPFTGINSIESFIQTDAAVNPGNSGGALVNTKGELIGINSAIKSNTGSFAGYSFAIPSNIVKKVVNDLIEYGSVQRAFIGIGIQNIDDELAKEENLENLNGVYVNNLSENGSAKEAGIKKGDVIIKVEGHDVNNVTELQAKIGEFRPGDEVELLLLRDSSPIKKTLTLRNFEGNTSISKNTEIDLLKKLGAKLTELNKEDKERLDLSFGVKVEELYDGKFARAGMKDGFVITGVDDKEVKSIDELLNVIKNKKGGILLKGLYRKKQELYYAFGM